jgi:hypothetical protein
VAVIVLKEIEFIQNKMEISEILKTFASNVGYSGDIDTESVIKQLETDYYPHVLKLVQKDSSFFSEPRELFGVNLSEVFSEENAESIWKDLHYSLIASFTHGDIKEKLSVIMSTVKNIWFNSGQDNDEVSKLLNDEESEGKLKEIFEYLTETRIAKIFKEIVEDFDITELELNFDNPMEIVDMVRNPENPVTKKVVHKVQSLLEEKLKRGSITQHQLLAEVEGIKSKLTSMFGSVIGDALGIGGGKGSTANSSLLMGNSPEARRQRMLARLQRKQRDKNSL